MKRYFTMLLLMVIISTTIYAQRKWTGAADGFWDNPLNWEPAGVPVVSDQVVLDNSSFQSDYEVTLPVHAVTITSVQINPTAGHIIRLSLPATNLTSPALVLTDIGEAVILNRGAIFRNASGLTSGQSLKIAGTIRINNGGTYIHNTRSAHANDIVARLSVAEGTEEGVFEFDIPSSSSTISLSNRSFGKLKLSAISYNANVSYSGAGSNPVNIRSDLEIGERVNFSIGFSNIFSIKRNLLQNGGTFNISNDNNATIVALGGNLLQAAGQITETGTAAPVLHLNGTVKQDLQFASGILNDIIVRMDNPEGAELKTALYIAYRLELKNGKIKTSSSTLLTLLASASLQADSLSKSFVDGPLRKEGLMSTERFLFPVGKSTIQRWVELKNATGNFMVAYKQQNPYDFSTVMDAGLDHVSSIETWTIDADATPAASAQVELSFDNVNSGGVSDLNTLRVAGWITGIKWNNRGNKGVTGSAGAAGSVISEFISDFNPDRRIFTLASSVRNQNTLPENQVSFNARKEGSAIRFEWQVRSDLPVEHFVIESAVDGIRFQPVKTILNQFPAAGFSLLYNDDHQDNYFRIEVNVKDGVPFYSKVVMIKRTDEMLKLEISSNNNHQLNIKFPSEKNESLLLELNDASGRLVLKQRAEVFNGENRLSIPVALLRPGVYYVSIISKEGRLVGRFIKK